MFICAKQTGQTGSGKTYTMMGHSAAAATTSADNLVDSDDDTDDGREEGEEAGIIPRLCKDLLQEVNQLKKTQCSPSSTTLDPTLTTGEQVIEAYMRAAYYEIYNEKLYDLLALDYEVPRKVREHASEGAYVEGLTYSLIQTYEDIEGILLTGQVCCVVCVVLCPALLCPALLCYALLCSDV
jgi:kinesin family member 1